MWFRDRRRLAQSLSLLRKQVHATFLYQSPCQTKWRIYGVLRSMWVSGSPGKQILCELRRRRAACRGARRSPGSFGNSGSLRADRADPGRGGRSSHSHPSSGRAPGSATHPAARLCAAPRPADVRGAQRAAGVHGSQRTAGVLRHGPGPSRGVAVEFAAQPAGEAAGAGIDRRSGRVQPQGDVLRGVQEAQRGRD